jgi:hypothetical protein
MADSKYGSSYRAIRRAYAISVARGEAVCAEPTCLMPTRAIAPGSKWDLCHDPTGTRILGPGHSKCNRSEGATRGNKARTTRFLKL